MRSAIGPGSITPSRAAATRPATTSPIRLSRQTAATGCPLQQPSVCPGETRFDPVENYMDYSDDACMKHFTPMQYQRIKDMVGYYRYQAEPADEPLRSARADPQKHRVRPAPRPDCVRGAWLQRQSRACLQEYRRLRHRRLRRQGLAASPSRPSAGRPIATPHDTMLGAAPQAGCIDRKRGARSPIELIAAQKSLLAPDKASPGLSATISPATAAACSPS